MANYCCTIRTNYFHVKDADAFREFMSRVYGSEDSVELWEEKDKNGETVFGFGVYGGISGVRNSSDDDDEDFDETAYDEFIDGLQKHVRSDDAVIILESGNEKMRYVIGSATIITSDGYEYRNITDYAVERASKRLNNDKWTTRCDY